MTRYLIGLFLMAILLARPTAAQATTTSTTNTTSSTTSTSTTTTTSSTSNTVPCLANGQPCGLDKDCCSGNCNIFGLCETNTTSTTSTSTSSSVTTTTSTSLTTTTSTSVTTTTSTSSSTTTSTIIVYDDDGAFWVANTNSTGVSLKTLRFETNRPQALTIHTVLVSGTGTSQIEQSLDGGTTWTKIGSDITTSSLVTIEHPTGLIRSRISACTTCVLTQWWSMQRNP